MEKRLTPPTSLRQIHENMNYRQALLFDIIITIRVGINKAFCTGNSNRMDREIRLRQAYFVRCLAYSD